MDRFYNTYIGIDIGKFEFIMNIHGTKAVDAYTNDLEGFKRMYKTHKKAFKDALVVLETTGGYERKVIEFLQARTVSVHRASGRIIKNYIRSHGIIAKTDTIDAIALSLYASERHSTLKLYEPDKHEHLRLLNERRQNIIEMRTKEKNRMQAPLALKHTSYSAIIELLNGELEKIDQEIREFIASHPEIKAKIEIVRSVSGVGEKSASIIVGSFPEIGTFNHKEIASMAGVAPHPNQSGKKDGYRRTRGGRRSIRPILFMCALAASRSKSKLGDFYRRLVGGGKKPMCALIAVMRKIMVISNARVKEKLFFGNSEQKEVSI